MTSADDKGIGIKGWLSGQKPRPQEGRPEPAILDRHRIAVLPFSNISPDPRDEYFADGMTEELISTVGRIGGLSVIARTSALRYKAGGKSVSEIGQELNVGNVLEGSVRKAGERLRVTVQLVETVSQARRWSESYDRELRDVFAIQSDIAEKVAEALKLQLLGEEQGEKKAAVDVEAYTAYLKGRFYWNQRTPDSIRKAVQYFEQAIAKDSEFVLAYVGLADCYLVLADQGILPPGEARAKSKPLLERALKMDDRLAEAHTSLANLLMTDWHWRAAEAEYKRAISLNPNYVTAHHWYSLLLMQVDRHEEALEEIRVALQLDPVSPILNMNLALNLALADRYEESIEQFKRTLTLDPNFGLARAHLGGLYLSLSKFEEGIAELQKSLELLGRHAWPLALMGYAYALKGERKRALEFLSELEEASKHEYVPNELTAIVYYALGEKDKAYVLLEKAFEAHASGIPYYRQFVIFRPISRDPRFKALLDRVTAEA